MSIPPELWSLAQSLLLLGAAGVGSHLVRVLERIEKRQEAFERRVAYLEGRIHGATVCD